jgi:uncharacterized membrane protein
MAGKRLDPVAPPDVEAEERSVAKRAVVVTALSVAGMGVAAYLVFIHFRGGQYFCGGIGDCDYVNSSPYAVVLGVPVALFGLLTYVAILCITVAGERAPAGWMTTFSPLAVFALSLAGVLFSAYLTYLELYVLYAI